MKRLLFISIFMGIKLLEAQPPLKVYAFYQVFTPGMVPSREIRKQNQRTEYYIYVSMAKTITIQPKEIFVKDKWYYIDSVKTVKTSLVPATNSKVIQIKLGLSKTNGSAIAEKNRKKFQSSAIFISYIWKNRIYYTALRSIKQLESVRGI